MARSTTRLALAGTLLFVGLVASTTLLAVGLQQERGATGRASSGRVGTNGRQTVLVELREEPGAIAYAVALERRGTRDAQAVAAAAAAGRRQLSAVAAEQLRVGAALAAAPIHARELFRVQRAMNAIAVTVDGGALTALRRLPGVKAVHPLEREYPHNSTSVPFIRAQAVWNDPLLGLSATGAGIRIGIIDTGIDYQHPTFGGTGLLTDYQANDRTAAPDSFFPTAKVAGGWDFAGDAYDGDNTPSPDADPMDCNGHGTHVAGTAAGFGVKSDGTTYTGPFGVSTPFSSLRIGPGTAPEAQLYALRVFGCGGYTNLTVPAIDWAMDPNGDNDLSDRLDVINMSLGSMFGSLTSTSARAADNAARAGVIVVASAGNAGDTYFISGSPGSADRAIAVAASRDDGFSGDGVTVNAPASIAGTYAAGAAATFGLPPPAAGITGDVVVGLDAADADGPLTTDGCSALTNAAAVAGHIALFDYGDGTCFFVDRVKHAQEAGAIAVLIASDVDVLVGMGGTDPSITIPSVLVPLTAATAMKANIATLNVSLFNAGDTIASFSSRGPRGGPTRTVLKPDVAAPGFRITSAQSGITCTDTPGSADCISPSASGFLDGGRSLRLSGTSMAAPHIAGVMALLRQMHPDWSVEELKALVMNRALQGVTVLPRGGASYGPSRVGAGRVDALNAALGSVVAFNADEPGLVSLSFEGDVLGTVTRQKRLRLVNHGTTAQTYELTIDLVTNAPGVAFSTPGATTVTVPPAQSVELIVQMDADAALMERARDASVEPTQTAPADIADLGELPRQWLTEESGHLTLRQGGLAKLRVPVYVAAAPVSDMRAGDIVTGGAPTGSTTIPLSGTGVCTGTLAADTCTGSFSSDVVSLVSPFELQASSPQNPAVAPGFADLQYVGISYSGGSDEINFGVSTWGPWKTPTDVAFNVYVDCGVYAMGADFAADTCTGAPDGTYDVVLFNSNPGDLAFLAGHGANPQDSFINAVYVIAREQVVVDPPIFLNRTSAAIADTRVFDNQVLVLSAPRASLKIGGAFTYRVESCLGERPLCGIQDGTHLDEAPGPYTWNHTAQGVDFDGRSLLFDLDGAAVPVAWSTANLAANGSLGALLLHHHNVAGRRAEPVLLDTVPQTDLAVALTADATTPSVGQHVTFTVHIWSNGPQSANGVRVRFEMPPGMTYVSDTGAGAFDSASGLWTVPGTLASTESRTLEVVASADIAASVDARATVYASAPVDPIAENDVSTIGVMAPGLSDLAVTVDAPAPGLIDVATPVTVTVKNAGADPAYTVRVANAITLGSGLIASGTPSAGLFDAGTGEWRLASLAPGVSHTLTLGVRPSLAPSLTLRAQASTSSQDASATNDTGTATVVVETLPTTTTAANATATTNAADQPVVLTATINSSLLVDAGIVTFTVRDESGAIIGTPIASAPVTSGTASATYTLPGGTPPQTLHVTAAFTEGARFSASSDETRTLTVEAETDSTRVYTLAEGATGSFFETRILLANPHATEAPVTLAFTKDDGGTVTAVRTLAPMSRSTVVVSEIEGLESGAMSTTVTSTTGLPLVVERTMQWDATGYGAHTEKAEEGGSTSWYFAEGAQGLFSTFLLLANPQATANTAHVTYFREGLPPLSRDYPIAAGARHTVDLRGEPALAATSFGARVLFDQPGFAERASYFGRSPFWSGGHASAGAKALSQTWLFAEGATGSYFSTFLLIANPLDEVANVSVTYLPAGGAPIVKTYAIAGGQRLTLNVADQDASLAAGAVGARVDADRPIVAERAQYWPQPDWIEGHSSLGITAAGRRWGLAEGVVGGTRAWQTYILLVNPSDAAATVTATFLRESGAPLVKTFTVAPHARRNIWIGGAGTDVPELTGEAFGTLLDSTQPIVVERSVYGNANGIIWAIGTNATATALPPVPVP